MKKIDDVTWKHKGYTIWSCYPPIFQIDEDVGLYIYRPTRPNPWNGGRDWREYTLRAAQAWIEKDIAEGMTKATEAYIQFEYKGHHVQRADMKKGVWKIGDTGQTAYTAYGVRQWIDNQDDPQPPVTRTEDITILSSDPRPI